MGLKEKFNELFSPWGARAELAKLSGVSHQNLTKWVKGSIPGADQLAVFCKKTDISANWLLLDIGPKHLSNHNQVPPERNRDIPMIPDVVSRNMALIEEWVREQDDPNNRSIAVMEAMKDSYPKFAEWLKKSDITGSQNLLDEPLSANRGEK